MPTKLIYPISQFTCENDFMHYTQNEDHDSRRAGQSIGTIKKSYRGREWMMTPYNELLSDSFESINDENINNHGYIDNLILRIYRIYWRNIGGYFEKEIW